MAGFDVVLVERALLHTRDKSRPDAGAVGPRRQRVRVRAPAVKVPDYSYTLGIRRPDREVSARTPFSPIPAAAP